MRETERERNRERDGERDYIDFKTILLQLMQFFFRERCREAEKATTVSKKEHN